MMGFNQYNSFPSYGGFSQFGGQPSNSIVGPPAPPSNPPNLSGIDKEDATEYSYDPTTKQWDTRTVVVSCEPRPFTEGSMRWCYKVVNHTDKNKVLIGKLYKTPETRETFFTEVEMQVTAGELAKKFNERGPPKKIRFVIPKVIELTRKYSTGESIMMSVESKLDGVYKKHSNNYGWCSPDNRNTPAAFSHFTYDYTGGKMLVCDMQGVDDVYTDPQIHTPDFKFGFADIGSEGIQQFFTSHRCNHVCRQLGLSQRPAKQCDHGTRVREEVPTAEQPHTRSHVQVTTAPSLTAPVRNGRSAYSADITVQQQPHAPPQQQQQQQQQQPYYYAYQPQYSTNFAYPYGITA